MRRSSIDHVGAGAGAVRVEDRGVAEDEPRHRGGGLVGSGRGSGTVLGHGGNDSDQNPTTAVARPPPTALPMPSGRSGDALAPATPCSARARSRPASPFRERLGAAEAGGFTGISLWGRDYQVARDEGLSDLDIRLLLADHGLSVAELDPCLVVAPRRVRGPHSARARRRADLRLRRARAVRRRRTRAGAARSTRSTSSGARGPSTRRRRPSPASATGRPSTACSSTSSSCPWSRIPDLATAWDVVRAADRPNGGLMLDAWHYFRSEPDGELLRAIPGASILGVQLCDAPADTRARSAPRHAARAAAAGRRASWHLATPAGRSPGDRHGGAARRRGVLRRTARPGPEEAGPVGRRLVRRLLGLRIGRASGDGPDLRPGRGSRD